MDVIGFLLLFLCVCFLILLLFVIVIFMTSLAEPEILRDEEEKYFFNPLAENAKELFPDLFDDSTVELSVIVPAYNEEERLRKMLNECVSYLETRKEKSSDFTYEIIVVDDGSKDTTSKVAREYTNKHGAQTIRVMTLTTNRGKGGAVRLGMLSSRGSNLIFADADGATKFSDLEKLEESLKDLIEQTDKVVVIGSRAHLEKESIAKRSLFRTFLMFGFHFLVCMFGVKGVRDTQCGFKLCTRKAAQLLYPSLHVERWAFDVELLYIAKELEMPVSEVPVTWTEIEGSKVVPFWSWIEMLRDLLLIWFRYKIGAWRIAAHKFK